MQAPAPRGPAKSRAVDRLEVAPTRVDGKAFVARVLVDIKARVAKGEKVRAVFDIDDTLADTRVRTLHIAKAWDLAQLTHHFDRLTLAQVGHDGVDTARAMGLGWAAEKAFAEHWETAFWDGNSFVHDSPIAPMVELARQARAAGAELVYLTGRVQDREWATIAQLERFGLPADSKSVVSKPDLGTRTVPFKAQWLMASAAQGHHLAFFVTESRRDVAGIQAAFAGAQALLLDSPFGGTDPVHAQTPIYPRSV